VQQEDKGVTEGGMRVTNRTSDEAVGYVVLACQEIVHVREGGSVDSGSVLSRGIWSADTHESGQVSWWIEWVIVRVECVV
jgi:hypothetical protein